jgi:hypothetical protein
MSLLPSCTVHIESFKNKYLDVTESRTNPGANVIAWWHKHKSNNQRWTFVHHHGEWYFLRTSLKSNMVLDVYQKKTNVVIWPKKDSDLSNQLFKLEEPYIVSQMGQDMVLTVDMSTHNVCIAKKRLNDDTQKWTIHRAE